MKIAQIAPLIESVPPGRYGGTERIVSYLTEELVRQGHEVVLFASADSVTAAELVPACNRALRLAGVADPMPWLILQLEQVRRRAAEFDILHFHTDSLHLPLLRCMARPAVTTMHGRLDLPGYPELFAQFQDMALVSISHAQRRPLSAGWVATIPHGLPADLYRPSPDPPGSYLTFLGRICPEKGPERAIEIARRAGVELRIAAKVDRVDRRYFDEVIRPLLDDPLVTFLGEVDDASKCALLANSRGLLFPIDWPEPFGLAMIESMACGTPVIAFGHGSVPEVIEQGRSGFIVDTVDEAVAAIGRLAVLDRRAVRACFDSRFTAARMAQDYLRIYQAVASAWAATHDRTDRMGRAAQENGRRPLAPAQPPMDAQGIAP